MANYWLHNGFLQVEGEKMSKSLGNFVTINELLETNRFGDRKWPGEVVRFAMLRTHYRSPIDWTADALGVSKKAIDYWYEVIGDNTEASGEIDDAVRSALADDLNVPNAIARLHELANEARGSASGLQQIKLKRKLKASAMMLGLLDKTRREYLESDPQVVLVDTKKIEFLLADRTAARARKDWKESDRIRDELAAMGVAIKDSKEGTTWEIAR
jgi:cysteinyl-tRNA synthetase